MARLLTATATLSLYNPNLKPTNPPKLGFISATNFRPPIRTPREPFIKAQFRIQSHSKPVIPSSPNPNLSLLQTLSRKAAVLIVGSLLLLGRFNSKPALAQSSNLSENLEEKVDAQKEEKEGDDEEMYLRILEKHPNNLEALKIVLYGKMKKGQMGLAVEYVKRLIALEPEEVEWRLLEAVSYELMGDLGKAKKLFREILKKRPLLIRALHGLALAMHKNHEGPAVFEMLSKALQLAQREKRVTEERNIKLLIAQMHVVQDKLEEALELFQDLIKENPRDFRPYLCQGIIYSLLDRKKEADEQFEIYRTLIPEEYPQKDFINDVILAAKTESQEQLKKDFESEFSFKN